MFKTLLAKLKALFTAEPQIPTHVVDDVHISFFQSNKQYPSGEHQIEMFYRGMLVEKTANEWSVSILVSDILAAKYDYKIEDNDTSNLIRSIFNIRHNRTVDIEVDGLLTVRFIFNFFTNEKEMKKFHEKINPFANDPAAQAFIGNM